MPNVDVINLADQETLKTLIAQGGVVVVKFTAPSWCRPCQQFAPHFAKAATQMAVPTEDRDAVKFVSVDVDLAPWAMVEYGVRGVPTVKLYKDGDYLTDLRQRSVITLINEITPYL